MKKKWAMAALLAFSGLPVLAQSGGFRGDEPPPPPNKQESGYRGTVDARHTSIATAKRMKPRETKTPMIIDMRRPLHSRQRGCKRQDLLAPAYGCATHSLH